MSGYLEICKCGHDISTHFRDPNTHTAFTDVWACGAIAPCTRTISSLSRSSLKGSLFRTLSRRSSPLHGPRDGRGPGRNDSHLRTVHTVLTCTL